MLSQLEIPRHIQILTQRSSTFHAVNFNRGEILKEILELFPPEPVLSNRLPFFPQFVKTWNIYLYSWKLHRMSFFGSWLLFFCCFWTWFSLFLPCVFFLAGLKWWYYCKPSCFFPLLTRRCYVDWLFYRNLILAFDDGRVCFPIRRCDGLA